MGEFCSRCGKTLSLIDPLLELKGQRFCEDCYPDAKREQVGSSMTDKLDKRNRVAFGEAEFKWDNPSLSLIASALRILTDQNKILMKQNELILRELERVTVQPVKTKSN